ncbi:MAG: Cof-type HAD-IIB family hydrolase [Lachnospiraceae bacterium]|nr:Cof-type HAD-IIB family hydrolase [Lachnospiraceae bacterium]
MIQLLAIDMDGTCLNQHSKISAKTMTVLKLAAKAGIQIVPATGRALSCLPYQLSNQKDLYRYVISSNGAQVTDCTNMKSVYTASISKSTALSLLSRCSNERLGISAHISHEYLVQGYLLILLGYFIYGRDAGNTKYVRNMAKAIQNTDGDLEELQFYFLSKNAAGNTKNILAEFSDLSAAYDSSYVEIFPKNASKGEALSRLASYLHIQKECIACIGDGENDLGMFRVSGLRFAMGNAVSALKQQADYILPSNREDGVAEAISRYILHERTS